MLNNLVVISSMLLGMQDLMPRNGALRWQVCWPTGGKNINVFTKL